MKKHDNEIVIRINKSQIVRRIKFFVICSSIAFSAISLIDFVCRQGTIWGILILAISTMVVITVPYFIKFK